MYCSYIATNVHILTIFEIELAAISTHYAVTSGVVYESSN